MKTIAFLTSLVIVLALALLLTVSELQRCKRILEQAQTHADTIYRGQKALQDFCQQQIEEAKCKPL